MIQGKKTEKIRLFATAPQMRSAQTSMGEYKANMIDSPGREILCPGK